MKPPQRLCMLLATYGAVSALVGCSSSRLAPTTGLSEQARSVVVATTAPLLQDKDVLQWVRVRTDGGELIAAVARPHGSGRFPALIILHGSHGFAEEYVRLAQDVAAHGIVGVAAALAAIVLLATAAFHATGYEPLREAVSRSTFSPFFRKSVPGIWLFFSWHLIAAAFALGWVSLRGSRSARPLLVFTAVLVCVDALFVFSLAGFFAGTALLAAAAACTVFAAVQWPGT